MCGLPCSRSGAGPPRSVRLAPTSIMTVFTPAPRLSPRSGVPRRLTPRASSTRPKAITRIPTSRGHPPGRYSSKRPPSSPRASSRAIPTSAPISSNRRPLWGLCDWPFSARGRWAMPSLISRPPRPKSASLRDGPRRYLCPSSSCLAVNRRGYRMPCAGRSFSGRRSSTRTKTALATSPSRIPRATLSWQRLSPSEFDPAASLRSRPAMCVWMVVLPCLGDPSRSRPTTFRRWIWRRWISNQRRLQPCSPVAVCSPSAPRRVSMSPA